MSEQILQELLALEKKFFSKLSETLDISRELADAIDRQDQVTVTMLLSMRQKPLLELQEINSYIELKRHGLRPEEADRFEKLIVGAPAEHPAEIPLAEQVASNRRLLDRLTELDRQISQKLCGEQSFYTQAQ